VKLTLGTGAELQDPTEEQVEAALRQLPGGPDSFAILGSDEQTYMQTSGGAEEGFVLEYREGSPASHSRCTNHQLSADAVVAAFRAYLGGRADYKADLAWELDTPSPGSGSRVALVAISVLSAAAFIFYRCGS